MKVSCSARPARSVWAPVRATAPSCAAPTGSTPPATPSPERSPPIPATESMTTAMAALTRPRKATSRRCARRATAAWKVTARPFRSRCATASTTTTTARSMKVSCSARPARSVWAPVRATAPSCAAPTGSTPPATPSPASPWTRPSTGSTTTATAVPTKAPAPGRMLSVALAAMSTRTVGPAKCAAISTRSRSSRGSDSARSSTVPVSILPCPSTTSSGAKRVLPPRTQASARPASTRTTTAAATIRSCGATASTTTPMATSTRVVSARSSASPMPTAPWVVSAATSSASSRSVSAAFVSPMHPVVRAATPTAGPSCASSPSACRPSSASSTTTGTS